VLAAAGELADAEGLAGLTLGRLAERLGVKTPSLYNHVAGLPDVQRELALRAKRTLCAQLARAAIGKAQDDAVFALCGAFRAFIKAYPTRYALTVRPASPGGPEDREMQAADAEVVEVVLAALASYRLCGQDAIHAVRGLRSVVHGFSTLELTGGFGLPLDADASFRILCQMLVAGLRALAAGHE
jgi:AcrR family transcriptional regulator